jgi:hypothetical protein
VEQHEVGIDWASAEVEEGHLTVPLTGTPPKGWKDSFARTATLLGESRWSDVAVKKGRIRVRGLKPGEEEDLRFYLEGVVEQANAAHRPEQETGADTGAETSDDDAPEGPDAEMTARFRGFAQGEQAEEEPNG